MDDPDTFVFLNGKGVRRSEFTPESFEFGLPPGERGRPPADILHDAMQPLIDLARGAGRLAASSSTATTTTRCSAT